MIFNSSMPRSGSELIQVLLHQNPRIYGSATSPLLEYQFAARGNYDLPEVKSQEPEQQQDAFISMCKSMAEGYYAPITDRPIICDKNRGWAHYYEWVAQWNPDPKMICCVRDIRSIIASMERVYRANRHRPSGTDNPAKMEGMTVMQRADYWLNTQPIGLALQRTQDTWLRGIGEKIHWVRYEDLCTSPQAAMDRIYDYIGEPSIEHDFENIHKEVYEDDSVYGIYGSHKVGSTIRPVKPSDWSDVLPAEVANNIAQQWAWYQSTFNY
ncbi:MAG: sulfotransferase [Desulfocapsa sp.]|nr:sulfotransferase [Desulfocapsa sp.]